jgi:hypothetical protein
MARRSDRLFGTDGVRTRVGRIDDAATQYVIDGFKADHLVPEKFGQLCLPRL